MKSSALFELDFDALLCQEEENYASFEMDATASMNVLDDVQFMDDLNNETEWEDIADMDETPSLNVLQPQKWQRLSTESCDTHNEIMSNFINYCSMNPMANLSSQVPTVCETSIQNVEHQINIFYEQHLDSCPKKQSQQCISTFLKHQFVAMATKISLLSHEFKEFFIQTILNAMTPLPGLNELKKQTSILSLELSCAVLHL